MAAVNERPTWRRRLREFVIFVLLGPVVTAIVYLTTTTGIELYKAPKPAPYTTRPASLIPLKDGGTAVVDVTQAANSSRTMRCFSGNNVLCEMLDDGLYVYDWNNPAMRGKWYRFAADVPLDRIQRTVYRTPTWAYIQINWGDAAILTLIFGWLVGAGVWIFYRLIRFAVTG